MVQIKLEPGKYVVAVSGGVDSVVLLNLLSVLPKVELIVAHFDHGIRADSDRDAEFVAQLAEKYGLKYQTSRVELGSNASEASAREKRYEYLRSVMEKCNADTIVTAHHKDDTLETAIINLLRGTNRKGLSSLQSSFEVRRPLLGYSKQQIVEYAETNSLDWREDPSNSDTKYLRNYIRKKLKTLDTQEKQALQTIIENSKKTNVEIDTLLDELFEKQDSATLSRYQMIELPYEVCCELMTRLLRVSGAELNSKRIHQLVQKVRTQPNFKSLDVDKNWILIIEKDQIRMQPRQSV